ncbi:MAG: TIGR03936 family radical SAM-associated protein [Candidatus Nanopelagicales bacterium]
MAQRRPDRELVPPVQRLRIRYAKRGRMRFTSHRDFQRALERALRRIEVPMAYSAGFSPHPKISYVNAAPTGAASEAEYVEIAVIERCDPVALQRELDAALPLGLDLLEVVEAVTSEFGSLMQASRWVLEFPQTTARDLAAGWDRLWGADRVEVTRRAKVGERTFDVRGALLGGALLGGAATPTLEVTLRHESPAVRPDDVVAALAVLGFAGPVPAVLTRLAQGPLLAGEIGDPLAG